MLEADTGCVGMCKVSMDVLVLLKTKPRDGREQVGIKAAFDRLASSMGKLETNPFGP